MPEAMASAERYTVMHPGTDAPFAHHHCFGLLRRRQNRQPRSTATRKAPEQLQDPQDPLSGQQVRPGRGQPHPRSAEDQLAASEMEASHFYLTKKNYVAADQPLQGRGLELPNHGARRGSADASTECYMAHGGRNEAQTAVAHPRAATSKDRAGTKTPMRS